MDTKEKGIATINKSQTVDKGLSKCQSNLSPIILNHTAHGQVMFIFDITNESAVISHKFLFNNNQIRCYSTEPYIECEFNINNCISSRDEVRKKKMTRPVAPPLQ